MNEHFTNIARLIAAYLLHEEEISGQEEFMRWKEEPEHARLLDKVGQECRERMANGRFQAFSVEKGWKEMKQKKERMQRRRIFRRIGACAALAVMAAGTGLFFLLQPENRTPETAVPGQECAAPFLQARLIVDGKQEIDLHRAQGILADSTVVVSNRDSLLSYRKKETGSRPVQQQIIIPAGNTYGLILSDGTTVKLNAASELSFPSFFEGPARVVRLKGEAYFKVAGDPDRPFIVDNGTSRVCVYGTEFNVHAYPDEKHTLVTLVNGKVSVEGDGNRQVLAPGEQWKYNTQDGTSSVRKVDVSFFTAWKVGKLRFKGARLEDIMNAAARWYDVKVSYQSEDLKEMRFGCNFTRQPDIAPLLRIFEANGKIRIMQDGRNLFIMKR